MSNRTAEEKLRTAASLHVVIGDLDPATRDVIIVSFGAVIFLVLALILHFCWPFLFGYKRLGESDAERRQRAVAAAIRWQPAACSRG